MLINKQRTKEAVKHKISRPPSEREGFEDRPGRDGGGEKRGKICPEGGRTTVLLANRCCRTPPPEAWLELRQRDVVSLTLPGLNCSWFGCCDQFEEAALVLFFLSRRAGCSRFHHREEIDHSFCVRFRRALFGGSGVFTYLMPAFFSIYFTWN